ncbi:hypothetical protein HNO52_06020 [Billgrantia diversa]|uniref:DUF1127 domain-containing protein n=1 Tax=Halomonas sp. MCCC 1A13316 TaxID=2733487 RepID=UPI0018A3BE99|nr:DUF1127 domain-containing protein [Halomonas sp. MCCC 1A13316]QOR38113.1 hypothetical protein HNO52_06020 [Halomonas sp. MCCC 1A13316]
MAVLRTTRRLLRAVRTHYANRRRDASLRDCDPRMLKDIGLRWERGKLMPIHSEYPASAEPQAGDGAGSKRSEAESMREVCPRCGARLA